MSEFKPTHHVKLVWNRDEVLDTDCYGCVVHAGALEIIRAVQRRVKNRTMETKPKDFQVIPFSAFTSALFTVLDKEG